MGESAKERSRNILFLGQQACRFETADGFLGVRWQQKMLMLRGFTKSVFWIDIL